MYNTGYSHALAFNKFNTPTNSHLNITTVIHKNNMYECICEDDNKTIFKALGVSQKQAIYFVYKIALEKYPYYGYPKMLSTVQIIDETKENITTILEMSDMDSNTKCDNCSALLASNFRKIKEQYSNEKELQYVNGECKTCGAQIKIFND